MRLGSSSLAVLFSAAALSVPAGAQALLPWETASAISWRAGLGTHNGTEEPSGAASFPSHGPITVKLSADGTLRLVGAKGVRHLRMGLPGRPLRAWRDAGIPLPLAGVESVSGSWQFPRDTPLAKGIQALPWGGEDFRNSLNGLLWILDDGEHFLTVVHPATARVVFLPLPTGQDFRLRVTPGYLELLEKPRNESSSAPRRWSLPWLALMPQFAKLAQPEETPAPGTALIPFPKD
ncbi:MAG: hypothetical protein IPP78_03170 [Holophagaceae bacterium]|nr:hypothetical protein [Holophagaceae bacterium]